MSGVVIPDPDQLGIRVTPWTPLAQLVGVLRRVNPDASYEHLKAAAEDLRRGAKPEPAPVVDVMTFQDPEPVVLEARPPRPKRAPRKRQPKNEAEASMVPVAGGEPIPAEPPARW